MTIDMKQFYQAFFEEAGDLLAQAEQILVSINIEYPDSEDLNAIFRSVHSIKGGATTFGFNDMTEFTHVLENLLDRIRNNEIIITQEHVDMILVAKDVIQSQLDGYRTGSFVDQEQEAQIKKQLQYFADQKSSAFQDVSNVNPGFVKSVAIPVSANEGSMRFYRIELPTVKESDVENLRSELGLLGKASYAKMENGNAVISLDTEDTPESIISICSFIIEPEDLIITETVREIAQDDDFGLFDVALNSKLAPTEQVETEKKAEHKQPLAQEAASIRVGIEKVDQLINLIGELVITQAMIEQKVSRLDQVENEILSQSIGQLSRNTRDLQEAVMSIRMMPMDYVFSRFPRMVRDIASKLNKKIELVTEGASTELDKGLIERIIDPLTHLVRNSIDHGIESPEIRKALGKKETGRLLLSASNKGGNIVIEVKDDGAGLNRDKIISKARQNGMSIADDISNEDVWQLIFAPGFSTAEAVTDVSGRGVGMDVVKRNVAELGGTIQIDSTIGQGSTISISMPLTLAIMDGMSISLGNNIFIIPLALIIETMKPQIHDIKTVAGEGMMINVRGEYLPIIPLRNLFRHETNITEPTDGVLVILEADGKKAALFVDTLVGQQQVVIKSLETNFKKITGISGATIMGDGSVALIIDVPAVLKMGQHHQLEGAIQ